MVIQLLKKFDFAETTDLENKHVKDCLSLHASYEPSQSEGHYNIYFQQGLMLDTSDFYYYFGKAFDFNAMFRKLIQNGTALLVEE